MSNNYVVKVPVSTIWTDTDKPREIDQPAVKCDVDIEKWLENMTIENRKSLTDDNLVQTQVLYGQTVRVLQEKHNWVHVCIPDQPSSKMAEGYPGWMPKCHLSPEDNVYNGKNDLSVAVIKVPKAILYKKDQPGGCLSYQTRLFIAEDNPSEEFIQVYTPEGTSQLKRKDVAIYSNLSEIKAPTGENLINSGKMFEGLPYLWGGTSAFGFDCSGFVHTVHRAWGILIPRDAFDQAENGFEVEYKDLEPGDLIFFAGEGGEGKVQHVGMYCGKGEMLHAPSAGKGIEVAKIKDTKYEKKYCKARRYW